MVKIDFAFDLPASLQAGDNVYYRNDNGRAVFLGPVTTILERSFIVDADPATTRPDVGELILFAPSRSVEQSGLIGFYATCVMVNNSSERAELFAVSTEMFESSK